VIRGYQKRQPQKDQIELLKFLREQSEANRRAQREESDANRKLFLGTSKIVAIPLAAWLEEQYSKVVCRKSWRLATAIA
jgi:hypothetical protein